jgi:hypothetical protein
MERLKITILMETATHKVAVQIYDPNGQALGGGAPLPISGTVTIGSALPAGTNRIGVVTIGNIQRDGDGVQSSLLTEIGSGYLLTRSVIAAGTAQIGSVTASFQQRHHRFSACHLWHGDGECG